MKYNLSLYLLLFGLLAGCINRNKDSDDIDKDYEIRAGLDSLNKLSADSLIEKYGVKLPDWNKIYTVSLNDTYKGELVAVTGRIDDMEKKEGTYVLEVMSPKPRVLVYMDIPENKMPELIEKTSSSKLKYKGCFVFRFTEASKYREGYESYKIVKGELVDYFIFRLMTDTD